MRSDLHYTKYDVETCWYNSACEKYQTEECSWKCRKMQQTKFLLDLSNLPGKMRRPLNLDIRKVDKESAKYLNAILYDPRYFVDCGTNAYFYGSTGTGKTSWACKILNNYFASIAETNYNQCRGLFVSVPKLLRDIKMDIGHPNADPNFLEFIHTLENTDLVVWDDIIQTTPTDYESVWLYSLINTRTLNCKANIFTSNLTPEQLTEEDYRLASRICLNSVRIHFQGYDLRGENRFLKTVDEFLEANPDVFNTDSENYIGIPVEDN